MPHSVDDSFAGPPFDFGDAELPVDGATLQRRERRAWTVFAAILLPVVIAVSFSRWESYREIKNAEITRLAETGRSLQRWLDKDLRVAESALQRAATTLVDPAAGATGVDRPLSAALDAVPSAVAVRIVDVSGRATAAQRGAVDAATQPRLTLRVPLSNSAPLPALEAEIGLARLVDMFGVVRQSSSASAVLLSEGGNELIVDGTAGASRPKDAVRWEQAWNVEGATGGLRLVLESDTRALLVPWRERTIVATLFWSFFFGLIGTILALVQRQARRDLARMRAHAKHVALALQGGDLCLWDADLVQQRIVVDARGRAMLGLAAGSSGIDFAAWQALVHPEDWPAVQAEHEACLRGRQHAMDLRYRMRHAAGHWVWVLDRGKVLDVDTVGRPCRMLGTRLDISATVEAQQALQTTLERLRQVVRSSAIGVFDYDHLSGVLFSAPEHRAIWGFAPEDVPTLDACLLRLHPADKPRVTAAVMRGHDPAGEGVFDSEHRIVLPDGAVRWIRVKSRTIFERVGDYRRPARTIGGVTDITDKREASARLEQQARLLDSASDAIVVRSLDGHILYWNGGAERTYGWTAAEAVGRYAPDLLHQDPARVDEIREILLRVGEHSTLLTERCKDGRTVQMEGRLAVLRDADGAPAAVFSIKTDVTQRLQLEAQLRQSQRLEAVGQLTGGVAHDFNNLLTVILGNADLLTEELTDLPHLRQLAEMARDAAQRGAELTHGLLAFARRQPLQPRNVNVNERVAATEGLLRRTLPETIEIEIVRGVGLWPALVDPTQLESAVLNLVLNARDAMPHGGKITLETANAHVDQEFAKRYPEVQRGQYVLVSLSDTGMGMSAEQLSHAFEPFYTTKESGKGTGLGLSMVYGFVKQSNGHVNIYSELGHGTTVRLYLPRASSETLAESPRSESALAVIPAGTAVLVVEDDELVRRFAHDVLLSLGCAVQVARDAAAALQILQAPERIDLMFTDVVMPGGMNGRELAECALAVRPGLKVLFTSGYTQNAIVHHGRLDHGVRLLPKPYRRAELARAVSEALVQIDLVPYDERPR